MSPLPPMTTIFMAALSLRFLGPNAKVHLPGRLQGIGCPKSTRCRPIKCNGLILFMASLGWAETCPNLVKGIDRPSDELSFQPCAGSSPAHPKESMMRFYHHSH